MRIFPRSNAGFVLSSNSSRRSYRSRVPGTGREYPPGDVVRQTGIYQVIHHEGHRETHEVVMLGGDSFPPCETCNHRVRFKLVRTAPYIFQDEDFEENDFEEEVEQ